MTESIAAPRSTRSGAYISAPPKATAAPKRKRQDSSDDEYVPADASEAVVRHRVPPKLKPPRPRAKRPPDKKGAKAPRPSHVDLPASVQEMVDQQQARLDQMDNPGSEEGMKIGMHIDWLKSLPWKRTPFELDLEQLKVCLDEDHHGLTDVKERILEEMSLIADTGKAQRTVLCLVGPPGVGKTSIAKSIARARARQMQSAAKKRRIDPYQHCALGGSTEASDLRGHRRVYLSSSPGRIMQGMRNAGITNPVFVLDEVDKLSREHGMNAVAAALLEILDPEQNVRFVDHFVEHPFDLSDVLFVLTANRLASMPTELLSRCDIIEVPAYSHEDKMQVAIRHLIPKSMEEAKLKTKLVWDDVAVRAIIDGYTWEAGVRHLKQRIKTIVRKVAYAAKSGRTIQRVDENLVQEFLRSPIILPERVFKAPGVGMVHGLYASEGGGGILRMVAQSRHKRGLKLTGNQAATVRESMQIAYGYLTAPGGMCRAQAQKHGLHVSMSDGGTRKDGPSAGVAGLVAIASAYMSLPVDHRVAITGEIELDGYVSPVGGIAEKVAGAFRAGIRHAIIPRANQGDMHSLKTYTDRGMQVSLVETVDEVLRLALVGWPATPPESPHPRPGHAPGSDAVLPGR